MEKLYTYAVSRIRAKEQSLLSKQDLLSALGTDSLKSALSYFADKGLFKSGDFGDYNDLLREESESLWNFIDELKLDKALFYVFFCKRDFHNLKSAIKAILTKAPRENIYLKGGTVPIEDIERAVSEKDFSSLPENMRKAGEDAFEALLHTGDGQKCDMIIDKATLEEIRETGKNSYVKMISDYAELTVALSDIKIAARGNALSKRADFIKAAMAECDTLDIGRLSKAAEKSKEDLLEYLALTPYDGAATALNESFFEFEKWCERPIAELIESEKSNPFTAAPVVAYILACERQINAVRIILSGKANNLSEEVLKERIGELYV